MAKNNIQQFESIRILGSLLGTKVLEDLRFYKLDGQNPADYGVEKGLKLSDELSRYWRIAQTRWQEYQQQRERTDVSQQQLAIQDWLLPLLEKVLGYQIDVGSTKIIGEREFPITHFAHKGDMPLVLCGADKDLDKGDVQFGQEGRKRSPMGLAQEYLNAESKCLWAIVSNGVYLRLLRDNPAMTRSAYIEVDFARLFEEDNYADFATLWLLLHATRTAPREGSLEKSWLETWRAKGLHEGETIRKELRGRVEDALRQLGTGFVAHPKNTILRQKLDSGELTTDVYLQQVLRLVYRMLFLLTAEDRNIALYRGAEYKTARSLYYKGYSISSLRERARFKRNHDYYVDAWQQLLINFSGFANGQSALAQPALGGLFAESQCQDIDTCELQNRYFYAALYKLCYFEQGHSLARINYRDMNTEEFGSVYEALLELTPQLHTQGQWSFSFQGDAEGEQASSGNARKLSGAYYTPDSLVQELIKSALVPVIEDRLKGKVNQADKRTAILSITVCDPACGSGHFLLGAARRLAAELAQIDADKDQPTDEHYRHALRDVLANCIFGVDRNPMSVELAKVAMWIEGVEPGKALSFLDHHIVCGDALLGVMDLKQLEKGIPAAAFKALSGDDKEVCKRLGKANTAALKQLAKEQESKQFRLQLENGNALAAFNLLEALPAETTVDIAAKEIAYKDFLQQAKTSRLNHACDLVLGAFLQTKTEITERSIPTTGTLMLELSADYRSAEHEIQLEVAQDACNKARGLHWPLTFPQIFSKGGFDCVLGNPPWKRVQFDEQRFFRGKAPEIYLEDNKSKRVKLIDDLQKSNFDLWSAWQSAFREIESSYNFLKEANFLPLSAIDKFNLYATFTERSIQIMASTGFAGLILDAGIISDQLCSKLISYCFENKIIRSIREYENTNKIFKDVHKQERFSLITLGSGSGLTNCVFGLRVVNEQEAKKNSIEMSYEDLKKYSPDVFSVPKLGSQSEYDIFKKCYEKSSGFVNEQDSRNSWNVKISRYINVSDFSHEIKFFHQIDESERDEYLPLLEGKLFNTYDFKFATYDGGNTREVEPSFKTCQQSFYRYIPQSTAYRRNKLIPVKSHFLAIRDITHSTNERGVIATIIPNLISDYTVRIVEGDLSVVHALLLVASLNSLTIDFIARMRIGGNHLSNYIIHQLPILEPSFFSAKDIEFITKRAFYLTYISDELKTLAEEFGHSDSPFIFDIEARHHVQCELDAYFAKLYGLTRNELRYILEPKDVMGSDYPAETFRVLKDKEIKEFGEYRTQRLVLREFDRLTLAEANGEEYTSLLVPPPGQQADPKSTG